MKKRNPYLFAILPLYIFTFLFILGPIIYMVVISFLTNHGSLGYSWDFTFANYIKLFDKVYFRTFTKSLSIAFFSTLLTIIIGYPFGFWMSGLSAKGRKLMMLSLVLPFGINSLIRLYGWIIILQSKGILNNVLLSLHIIKEPLKILYSYPAVLIGMVYALLPFMIFSIYSSAVKLDLSLLDAARDLGANRVITFLTVSFPLTLPGLFAGIILTFVPSMGLFFIADILGGNKVVLVGSLIQDQMTRGSNWPFAAAIAVALTLITSVLLYFNKIISTKDGGQ
ncbi:MAG: ABC transporter permease [Spirochaetales bacterium]|nr:ABC transporter permease [Spirochaetales bacterium]